MIFWVIFVSLLSFLGFFWVSFESFLISFQYFESLWRVSFEESLWSLSLFCVLVSIFWAFFVLFEVFIVSLVLWVSLQYKSHSKILSLSQSKWKLCNASPPFHFVYFPFALISNYIEPHQHTTQPSCNPLAASNYNKRKENIFSSVLFLIVLNSFPSSSQSPPKCCHFIC